MSVVPKNAQQPLLSGAQMIWVASFIFFAATAGLLGYVVGLMVFAAVAIVGAIPHFNGEGAVFLVTGRSLRFWWKRLRQGNVYRRELSTTTATLQQGVSRMKGFFKVELVLLGVKLGDSKSSQAAPLLQVPALLKGRTHTIYLTCGSNPRAALADPDERLGLEYSEANAYADIASELGTENSFTIWSLHRVPDESKDHVYLSERLKSSLQDPDDPVASRLLQEYLDDYEEIMMKNRDRMYGLAMSSANPRSWKGSKLDSLAKDDFMLSRAVKAALVAEEKLSSIVSNPRVSSYPVFNQLLREILHLHEQELPRERALTDQVAERIAVSSQTRIDPALTFTFDDSPLPQMQQEVANNYLIFDGTYHRVLWVEDFLGDGSFDDLYTAKCDYFTSIYSDVKDLDRDDSLRQDRARLVGQLKYWMKRNVSASDEAELAELDLGRHSALEYGQKVPWFRLLVIVSGRSLEEMERHQDILRAHLARTAVRVKFRTVTGPDQLEWFFAALGAYGSS